MNFNGWVHNKRIRHQKLKHKTYLRTLKFVKRETYTTAQTLKQMRNPGNADMQY